MHPFGLNHLKMPSIFANRIVFLEALDGMKHRPLNVRRFARRYYWFAPGDIIQKMRPSMKFYMVCAIIMF